MLLGRVGVGLAIACAALGASQYAWNVRVSLAGPVPRRRLADGLRTFWFDVTKSDWRCTMVMGVHETGAASGALGLYWFDLLQQFGLTRHRLALVGLACLWRPDGGY